MNRIVRRARAAVAIAALALGALSATAPFVAASATSSGSKAPFTDPNINGWLTFCNRNNQPVTSGSLLTTPFVWKAISSAPPPPGYRSSKGRATLYGFQPLKYVDPGDWAGYELTGASAFSNSHHPVVQATNADQPLISFVQSFPLHWDGFAEIRMMWTAVNEPQLQFPYAAAIVRVTGSRWTLVAGGNAPCGAGKGVSDETYLLPKKDLTKAETTTAGGKSSAGAGGSSAKSAGGSAASRPSSGSAGSAGSASLAASHSPAGISAGALAAIGLAALALVWVAIGLIARRRRRGAVG